MSATENTAENRSADEPGAAPGGTDKSQAVSETLTELDSVALSALLSSRVCHDLINPVGAIGSGLEVLDDPTMDTTMQEAAMDLIRSGAKKSIALLSYARLAYGAAGGFGAQISLEDAQKALSGVFDTAKADLDWQLGDGYAAKENVKVLLILGFAAADSVPRGGTVTIAGDVKNFTIKASGKKVILQDDFVRALKGDCSEMMPKFAPAYIASLLIADAKGSVNALLTNDDAIFEASFPSQ